MFILLINNILSKVLKELLIKKNISLQLTPFIILILILAILAKPNYLLIPINIIKVLML